MIRPVKSASKGCAIVALAIAVYTAVLFTASLLRLYNFRAGAHDLGVFVQALSSTLKGKLLYEAPDFQLYGATSFLGVHFSPILLLLVPLYALFPGAAFLLFFQALLVALGAAVVYLIASRITHNTQLASIFSLLYLLYPYIQAANLYDFHVQAFFPLLFLLTYYFYLERKWRLFAATVALLTITIEVTLPFLFFFAIYALLGELKKERRDVKTLMSSTALLILSPFILLLELYVSLQFIEEPVTLGEHLSNISSFFFGAALTDLHDRVLFWILTLAPLCFLPLLKPRELTPIVPYIAVSFMSSYRPHYQVGWQYAYFIAPTLFVAMIHAADSIRRKRILFLLLAASVTFSAVLSPLNPLLLEALNPGTGGYNVSLNLTAAIENFNKVNSVTQLIPEGAVVLASYTLFPFVAENMNSYAILPVAGYMRNVPNPDFILLNIDERNLPPIGNEYGVFASTDGLLLFKRGYSGKPVLYHPFRASMMPPELFLRYGTRLADEVQGEVLAFLRDPAIPAGVTFWYGPYIALPPGTFLARCLIKVTNVNVESEIDHVMSIDVVIEGGAKRLAYKRLTTRDVKEGCWVWVELPFTVNLPAALDLEVRGVEVSNIADIYLARIEILQIAPYTSSASI